MSSQFNYRARNYSAPTRHDPITKTFTAPSPILNRPASIINGGKDTPTWRDSIVKLLVIPEVPDYRKQQECQNIEIAWACGQSKREGLVHMGTICHGLGLNPKRGECEKCIDMDAKENTRVVYHPALCSDCEALNKIFPLRNYPAEERERAIKNDKYLAGIRIKNEIELLNWESPVARRARMKKEKIDETSGWYDSP